MDGTEKLVMFEKLGVGLNLGPCSHLKKKKSEMLINLIVQNVTEVIGNRIFNSQLALTYWPFFFSMFHHERLVGWLDFIFSQVSLSILPAHKIWSYHRYFPDYHHTQDCLDETIIAAHSLVTDQTPPSIFEWYSKGKIQLKHQ